MLWKPKQPLLALFTIVALLLCPATSSGRVTARLKNCLIELSELGTRQEKMETLARAAGLHYVSEMSAGIARKGRPGSFTYFDPTGRQIKDKETLARIDSLAIPPAYKEVWISPDPKGHIQATAVDDRGRTQYRYHPRWEEARDAYKFHRMIDFGTHLPELRKSTQRDLRLSGLPKRKVLAAVVQLLDKSLIRIGNEEYAEDNGSYGLTTLQRRHVTVAGSNIQFSFRGKSGVYHTPEVRNTAVAAVVDQLKQLKRGPLFQYIDDNNIARAITSDDVNDYLREEMGISASAKDFRTWGGTVLATKALAAGANVTEATASVAEALGNTPDVSRKSYIHPAVLGAAGNGAVASAYAQAERKTPGTETASVSTSGRRWC